MQALELELASEVQIQQYDITDKLLAMLLNRLYIILARKLIALKPSYTLTIPDECAIALYLYYHGVPFNPTQQSNIIIKKICNQVDQQWK